MRKARRWKLTVAAAFILILVCGALFRAWSVKVVSRTDEIALLKEKIRHEMEENNRSHIEDDSQRLLELALLESDRRTEAFAYRYLGFMAGAAGQPQLAVEMHEKALAANESISDFDGMIGDYHVLYGYAQGDPAKSEDILKKLLEVRNRRHLAEQATTYGDLGRIAKLQPNRKDEARELFTKSRDMFLEAGLKSRSNFMKSQLDQLDGKPISSPGGGNPFADPPSAK